MDKCWICGNLADSEEHKFKASDLKKFHGKKMDAFYVSKEAIKLNSYKDKVLKFPKVICIDCNNNITRPHDEAYDKFVDFCFKNNARIFEKPIINFEEIYGKDWKEEKANLFRYYAKHAGCKIVTSNVKADLSNLSKFILGGDEVNDFIIRFELKAGVAAIMNCFNQNYKYNHLYNSKTCNWNNIVSPKFGGWLTNNYFTTNWVYGININTESKNILATKYEIVLRTDQCFFDIKEEQQDNDEEFSRLKFIDQYITGFENGYNKTLNDRVKYFEALILINNTQHSS